jgi:signal transduction histidine kinase
MAEDERRVRCLAEERDHDLRSGLLAIEAAVTNLRARAVVGSDGAVSDVVDEISRLRRLLASPHIAAVQRTSVSGALAPVLFLARCRGAPIIDDLSEDAETDVPADVLTRVTQILLDNALRHAPGARITVASRRRGDQFEVTVRDERTATTATTGSCAEPDDPSRSARPRHGVGLLSAERLVADHGGTLHVERTESGMLFTIDIPVSGHSDGASQRPSSEIQRLVGRRRTDRVVVRSSRRRAA